MAKKIVIVEDNTALAEIYKTRLELVGYAVSVAYDGISALETIQRDLPDLVLLDLMVPRIAGDEILRRMRESTWGNKIKVYIISNLNEADAPKGLRQMGFEGYAVKAYLTMDELDKSVDCIVNIVWHCSDVNLEMTPPEPVQEPVHLDVPVAAAPPDAPDPAPVIQMPTESSPRMQPGEPTPPPSAGPIGPAPHAQEYHTPATIVAPSQNAPTRQ